MCLGRPADLGRDAGRARARACSAAITSLDVALAIERCSSSMLRDALVGLRLERSGSDRSSSSHFNCQTPSRLASGAKRSSTSRAVRVRRSAASPRHERAQRLRALGELDQHHAHVLDHRQQHLAQVLRLQGPLGLVDGIRGRADFAHARNARRPRSPHRRRNVRSTSSASNAPATGRPRSSALRTESASSCRPPRIVAVPSARSSAGFAIGHDRDVACSRAKSNAAANVARSSGEYVIGEGIEPRGDRLRRGGVRCGVQHGNHAPNYTGRAHDVRTGAARTKTATFVRVFGLDAPTPTRSHGTRCTAAGRPWPINPLVAARRETVSRCPDRCEFASRRASRMRRWSASAGTP